MKAFYQTSYGGREVEKFGELPDPVPGTGQLLIRVKSVSINPVDYKIKNGAIRLISGSKFPKIVGTDFAGIVVVPVAGDNKFKAGDRVYGAASIIMGKPGALCELVAVDSDSVRQIPDGMSFDEAAALPVAALTALNGLRRCGVKAGSNLLINGATGGVGHFAIQIAKAKGAVITASCSEANSELARQLGANFISGYKREDLLIKGKKYDAIFDAWGHMNKADIFRLLNNGGKYASPMILFAPAFASFLVRLFTGKTITSSNMRSLPEDYEEIEKLFSEKKLHPVIENKFTIDKASDAFELAENGRPRGKIIVNV
jgi:NADPH:quinone reductase-like Zn-dependent oxidoreductase